VQYERTCWFGTLPCQELIVGTKCAGIFSLSWVDGKTVPADGRHLVVTGEGSLVLVISQLSLVNWEIL
jgi:hypothetical protein